MPNGQLKKIILNQAVIALYRYHFERQRAEKPDDTDLQEKIANLFHRQLQVSLLDHVLFRLDAWCIAACVQEQCLLLPSLPPIQKLTARSSLIKFSRLIMDNGLPHAL